MIATLLSLVLFFGEGAASVDLGGGVVGPDKKPIVGATVHIYSAAPKQGPAMLNAFDYPDCQKSALADAAGTFKIVGVDGSLNYRLLVLADGYRPLVLKKVDRPRGQITATLKEFPKDIEANQMIKGHVADSEAKPIVGARVEPYGCQEPGGNRWWGDTGQVCENETYSDAKGDFILITKKPDVQIDLKVFGPRVSPRLFPLVATGESVHEMGLSPGVALEGRLLKDDKPLAGVTMRLTQTDRGVEHHIGDCDATTDIEGKFSMKYLPANDDCKLFALQKSLGERGTLTLKPCRLSGDGTTVDAGDLAVEPGHKLAGKLVCSDGKPLPEDSKVYTTRWDANDTIDTTVGPDGKFEFKCVAPELSEVWVRVTGYHVSAENISFEPANANFLLGLIDDDIEDLRVQLDPGPNEKSNYQANKWKMLQTTRITGMPADK